MVTSILLCLINIFILFFINKNKINIFVKILLVLLCFFPVLYLLTHYVVNKFTGNGIDDTILFYLFKSGFPWESIGGYLNFIGLVLLVCLLFLASIIYVITHNFHNLILMQSQKANKLLLFVFISFSLLAVYFNPSTKNFIFNIDFNLVFETKAEKDAKKDEFLKYLAKNEYVKQPKLKKNLIYIYLESFELDFVTNPAFKNFNKNFTLFTQQGLFFDHAYEGIYGGVGTVHGMFTSQCGVGLFKDPKYMNNRLFTCMGDILSKLGYQNNYYGGAHSNFGGKDYIYKEHSFSNIYGRDKLVPEFNITNLSHWGIYDDDLFTILEKRFIDNHPVEPFSLTFINLDTHTPIQYSPSCERFYEPNGKQLDSLDGLKKRLQAIGCVDYLLGEFINRIRNSSLWDNTYIVLTSDHKPSLSGGIETVIKPTDDRRLYFVILGKDIKPKTITKQITKYDFGATILDVLGITDKLGLGRSALKQYSIASSPEEFNKLVSKWRETILDYINSDTYNDSVLEVSNDEVVYNKMIFKLPFVYNIYTSKVNGNKFSNTKSNERVTPDFKSRAFIWGSYCEDMSVFGYNNDNKDKYCLAIGGFGRENISVSAIDKKFKISEDDINQLLIEYRDSSLADKQINKLDSLINK